MKRFIVHLYGKSRLYTYGTVCGLPFSCIASDTTNKKKVTCKNCKKTKAFKNDKPA